jgi:endoribonuclease Nob1
MSSKPNSQCRRIIVLDTSAFLAGFDPFAFGEEQVTVPKVEEEIKRNSMIKTRFETAVESGKIKVKAPTKESFDSAKASANKVGDLHKLSETDMQLLALALELNTEGYAPQVVTDDYSIQNVAKQLKIEFVTLGTFGIKRLFEWIRYCPACHREYPANSKVKECRICGTELKRKPRRQQKS